MLPISTVPMTKRIEGGIASFNDVKVDVPVLNGLPPEALQRIPKYAWAEKINWDLAANLVADPRFRDWAAQFDVDLKVERFEVMSMHTVPGRPGIILFAEVYIYLEGDERFNYVMWSGDTAAVAVMLEDENGKRFVLLTEQARPAIGKKRACQFPAGIIEPDGFKLRVSARIDTAILELEQETGITLRNQKPQYVETLDLSQGRISERTHLYMVCLRGLTAEQINDFDRKLTGLAAEGEEILLRVVEIEDLDLITSGKPTSIAFKAIAERVWRRRRYTLS